MRPRHPMLALLIVALLGRSSPTRADEPAFRVIVNPKNPITSIDRDLLRNAFLKKAAAWKAGDTIRPVDLSSKQPIRDRFTRVVLKKSPTQLKVYWSQQIFSGKGVPPPEMQAPADVIAYVMANPGAVGYLPADVDPRGAKVIEVR
jgi:ABC-type phosphate transport system substrate-binding protein